MSKWFHIAAVLSLCAAGTSATAAPDAKYPLLEQLTVPKKDLPDSCETQEIPPDALPVKGLKNCSVTNDPKAFVIGDEPLKDLIDPKDVEAMYLALYREKGDCGLFGWAFKTEDDALKAYERLAAHYGNQFQRIRLWQAKNYVVWLWRDPGTSDECFHRLKNFVQAKVDDFKEQRAEPQPHSPKVQSK